MNEVSEAAVREVAETYQDDLVRDRDRYERGEYDSLVDIIRPARPKAFSIGIALLRLGDCERGREWLAISPPGFLDRLDRTDPADAYRPDEQGGAVATGVERAFRRSLHGAVLSRDPAVVTDTGERAQSLLDNLALTDRDDPFVGLVAAHAAALVDEFDDASDGIATALADVDRLAERYDNIKWELRMLQGGLNSDGDALRAATETHLDAHREAVRDDVYNTVWRCVDYPAAGFLAFAHGQGTTVAVASEFIPDCVYDD